MNFQLNTLVLVARPTVGHEHHRNQIGIIGAAYKSLRSGAKFYAVSLPCPKTGVQVVTFAAKELELAPETPDLAPLPLETPQSATARGNGPKRGVLRCGRCGFEGAQLIGISRCTQSSDGNRCGGPMEQL